MASGTGAGTGGPMLVFDFGGTKLDIAIVEERRILGRTTLDTEPAAGAEQAISRAIAAGKDLLEAHGLTTPVALGISTMGYTRSDGVDLAPNVPGWESLRLPALFTAAFAAIPCVIENDVRAAAAAEAKWGALEGAEPGVYLNLGTGIAAALLIGGEVLDGFHGAAGEIGYWLVPGLQADGGDVGLGLKTLEQVVGGGGLKRWSGENFAELLESRSPRAVRLAGAVIGQIAAAVTNLAIVIDPARIVLGGGFTRAGDRLLDPLRASISEHVPFPPELALGRFGSDAGLYGAVLLAERAANLASD